MRVKRSWFVLVGMISSCVYMGAVTAQELPGIATLGKSEPSGMTLVQAPDKSKTPDKAKTPDKSKTPDKAKTPDSPAPVPPETPPATDAFAQAPSRGGEAPGRGFNPHMLGDYQGLFVRRFVAVPAIQTTTLFVPTTGRGVIDKNGVSVTVTTLVPVTVQQPITVTVPFAAPIVSFGAFKIGENEGPAPEDRVFLTYNYFGDMRGPNLGSALPSSDTQTTTIGGNPAIVNTRTPAFAPQINGTREMFGFEKSLLDGRVSLGLRVPLVQQRGDGSFSDLGDITAIVKYAIWSDPDTGSVLSAGLALTLPTGPSISTSEGKFNATLFQPFVGYRWSESRFFLQGFTSVAVATDSRIPTLLFNDIGVGYKVYQGTAGDAISFISPIVEAHLTTPLSDRGQNNLIIAPDLVALVGGIHIGLYGASTLTLGVATPVTGPRPFDVEAIAQLNWRF